MLSRELGRCPFCNGLAEAVLDTSSYRKKVVVRCTMCEAQAKAFPTECEAENMLRGTDELEKAVNAWNGRGCAE